MKRVALLVFAALLVVMFSVPAMAMEHQFGGMWRTRFFTQQNLDGTDIEPPSGDWTGVDTRTRLAYTAVFHENLRFVTSFEMDATWGAQDGTVPPNRADDYMSTQSYGDFGSDGVNLEVKNSFVDFNLGPLHSTIGVQGWRLGRGFLVDTDVAGLMVAYQSDGIDIPFVWAKAYEGGTSNNALDVDYFALSPNFSFNSVSINPFLLYVYSDNGRGWSDTASLAPTGAFTDEVGIFYAGMNLDLTFNPVSLWLTGIYQGGDVDFTNNTSIDQAGWLGAIGAAFNFGMGDVHTQFFYATGDDGTDADNDAFVPPSGRSYYWSELMGLGTFDTATPANTPGDGISNVMAANLGVTIQPMDRLTINLDAWWAQLDEGIDPDAGTGFDDFITESEDDLGIEVDLVITYQLIEGLNLDFIGAYLFAGDAIYNNNDDADPYEVGSRLSLSF